MVLFDMFKKPKSFFPHKLQPGDTIRVYFMTPAPEGDREYGDHRSWDPKAMRETYFDGILAKVEGDYHARHMTMRAMVGKGEYSQGMELKFPMFSPLLTKMEVLRRGYIGQNKNCMWMRAMVGKKNTIPLDQERTAMDSAYAALRIEGREDEIPESDYPKREEDRYPLPAHKQFADDWEEENYRPEDVDQRTDYELNVIGKFQRRLNPSGRYGRHGHYGGPTRGYGR